MARKKLNFQFIVKPSFRACKVNVILNSDKTMRCRDSSKRFSEEISFFLKI